MSALWKRRRGTLQELQVPPRSLTSSSVVEDGSATPELELDSSVEKMLSCSTTCTELVSSWSRQVSRNVEAPHWLPGYEMVEVLGKGSVGKVLRATRLSDGLDVAVKAMDARDEQQVRERRREFEILNRLNHPNLVYAWDFIECELKVAMILSYHPGSTLDVMVKSLPERCFGEEVAQKLFFMLMSAIKYLHDHHVVHRDIKAENIIIAMDHQDLHLADFNVAKDLQEGGALTMTGTLQYSAPEVLDGFSPSHGQDIWGAGLCLHVMVAGRLPHRMTDSLEHFAATMRRNPIRWSSWSHISDAGKDTVRQCLCVEELKRPTASQILELPWLAE
ncbi:unnamed protein product [Durusdinium trenchii]